MTDPDRDAPNRSEQISFARHSFDNLQALIRFADTKAAFYATFLLFLAASSFPLAKEVIPNLRWALSSGMYLLSFGVLAIAFVWSYVLLFRIVAPREARHYRSVGQGHELLYYDHVVSHGRNTEFFRAVSAAPSELLLQNLTDQVFELAHICQKKMGGLRVARISVEVMFAAWFLNAILGLWIARWK